jgi:hypothetical protein
MEWLRKQSQLSQRIVPHRWRVQGIRLWGRRHRCVRSSLKTICKWSWIKQLTSQHLGLGSGCLVTGPEVQLCSRPRLKTSLYKRTFLGITHKWFWTTNTTKKTSLIPWHSLSIRAKSTMTWATNLLEEHICRRRSCQEVHIQTKTLSSPATEISEWIKECKEMPQTQETPLAWDWTRSTTPRPTRSSWMTNLTQAKFTRWIEEILRC